MGFWAKKRVEWSGYLFDCYDDCGAEMPFFNSVFKAATLHFAGCVQKVGDMCLFNYIAFAMTNSKTNLNT